MLVLKTICLGSILLTVSLLEAFAFDGDRKGFILGFGAGLGRLNYTQEVSDNWTSASAS
jgi:hypothetical protein